ncbi:MAG: BREX-1 system adenine-specific DNA-methyltransferase PglX, partial [Clostridia bacterium]|nr:BREX-1 system adenine-specific DNA-methyltransferase PglX [Clostridia bacterium]
MNTTALKNFAQKARVDLIHQVGAQLKLVLASDSLARREEEKAVHELEARIERKGKEVVVEEVAYTWFNRFCALRFMDVNRYSTVGVVSPSEAQTQPEILSDAKMGVFDENVVSNKTKEKVLDLLSGRLKSKDAQGEAYRLLLVSYCNHLNRTIPYLFERITDYTELLLPTNLLAVNSILAECRDAMTEEACKDVEVIGWLYQYYISEKKDDVFKNFKKGKKAGPREIPAATQLFTPHWIVRYLVENSLGRLWMLNHPRSNLIAKMEYYIKPEQEESDFLRISKPEEIKVCDPACGSGHMLTYAFDLLYSIYEEVGYDPSSIPSLILKNNLYGIEIDERAGELAAFALSMKARQKSRRFFNNPVEPNICVLKNVKIEPDNLKEYVKHVGIDLFSEDVLATLNQFEEADNFGSLIIPATSNAGEVLKALSQKNMEGEMFLSETHEQIITALTQADYLSQKYHVVVANPPYMGGGNMNGKLSDFAKKQYPNSKSDMCTMFIERNLKMVVNRGNIAMITMQSWMFLSSYEKLREKLIKESTITSMAHLGARAFDSIGGEVVSTTAFVIENQHMQGKKGSFVRLVDGGSESEKLNSLKEAIKNPDCGWFYRVSADDFQKIPGSPIAYWVSEKIINAFINGTPIGLIAAPRKGNTTTDNNRFLRFWVEVSKERMGLAMATVHLMKLGNYKWIPYNKGGGFRKWYGFNEYLINWRNNGEEIKKIPHSVIANEKFFFQPGLTWSTVTSKKFSIRKFGIGYIFDNGGCCVFGKDQILINLLNFMNSKVFEKLYSEISPTLNFQSGDVARVPFIGPFVIEDSSTLIALSKSDWDSYETSWDFTILPLLDAGYREATLAETYHALRNHWNEMTLEMQRLEEENNQIFIEAYGLEDELTPDVPLKEITLTCNPYYRYGDNKSEAELEALLLADTMKEFISYAVGCMFGRYSIDKPGLILASQGETYEDYCRLVPDSSFPADRDNAIPILDGEWFSDDIVSRFRKFLRVTFGEDHYEENLRFIERAIGKDLRQYFLKDFYNDHVKRYKKRPIYWMFSSPDGSFNVLIYMHRYRP